MTDEKKGLGRLMAESFSLFSKNLISFIGVGLISLLFCLAASICFFIPFIGLGISGLGKSIDLQITTTVFVVLFVFAIMAILFLYQIAMVKAVCHAHQGEKFSVWGVYKETLNIFWSFVFVESIVIIKVLLWTLLLIIPGIIFGIFYSFSSLSLILDGKKGNQALIHSAQIIKPQVWRFLGTAMLVGLVTVVLTVAVRIGLHMVFGSFTSEGPRLLPIIGRLVGGIFDGIVGIYYLIFFYFLYLELKPKTAVTA